MSFYFCEKWNLARTFHTASHTLLSPKKNLLPHSFRPEPFPPAGNTFNETKKKKKNNKKVKSVKFLISCAKTRNGQNNELRCKVFIQMVVSCQFVRVTCVRIFTLNFPNRIQLDFKTECQVECVYFQALDWNESLNFISVHAGSINET